MDKAFLSEFKTFLKDSQENERHILITSHFNPDGDALGSALGFYHFLQGKGISSKVIMPNAFPEFLNWMPGSDSILIYEKEEEADTLFKEADYVFILDYNTPSRVGNEMGKSIENSSARKFLIDHHVSPADCADVFYSDPKQPSTSQMVIKILVDIGEEKGLGVAGASCIFAGIITDTGSFRFPLVNAETMRFAALLFDMGIDHSKIYDEIYDSYDVRRYRLLGLMLNQMEIFSEYKVCLLFLTLQQQQQNNMQKGDTEGFVNYGLSIKGMKMAAFFREEHDGVRLSFRSKENVDVNEFSRTYFGGGGHINAAGGNAEMSLDETIKHFKKALEEFLPKENNTANE